MTPAERRRTFHNQPEDAARAARKLRDIPLRQPGERPHGYDALGILVVSASNDNVTPWTLVGDPSAGAPAPGEIHHYTDFIQFLATQYRLRCRLI